MIIKKKKKIIGKKEMDPGEQSTKERLLSAQHRNIGVLDFMKEEWELRKLKRDEKYGK
jgi:hypothetical protein